MNQCGHSLQFVASMIDRLIVVLSFALLIFMLGGASFYSGGEKSLPTGQPGGLPRTMHQGNPNLQAGEEAQDFPVEGNDKNDLTFPSPAAQAAEKPTGANGLPEVGTGWLDGNKAKNDCAPFPKRPDPDSSQDKMCSYLSRAIKHSNTCLNLHRPRDAKWQPRENTKNIRILYTRIQNLKIEYGLKCGSPREITGFRVFLKGNPLIFHQKSLIQERDWDDF